MFGIFEKIATWICFLTNGFLGCGFLETEIPSTQPSRSVIPSVTPTVSLIPSLSPTLSDKPSAIPSISNIPSSSPTSSLIPSIQPSSSPIPSAKPTRSFTPSMSPTFSDIPSSNPSISSNPSSPPTISFQPTISSEPSQSAEPSYKPSVSIAPSFYPSEKPSSNPSEEPEHKLRFGVYYYPWHGPNFHGGKYLREYLNPRQFPELGEYDDREASVISQHLAWSKQAHVSVWVCSWWGPDRRTNRILTESILVHPELVEENRDMKIAIHYETKSRTDGFTNFTNVGLDMTYLAENYFDHPNYYKIDDRPVIVVYLTRVMSRNMTVIEEFISIMRSSSLASGHDVYIIGDEVFSKPPQTINPSLALFDAVTDYDIYGSIRAKGYAGQAAIDNFFDEQKQWSDMARQSNTAFVPCVTPGFNDKGVRDGHEALSRKIDVNSQFGSLFSAMLPKAIDLVDESSDGLLLITSFNEWHEDTQIEPVQAAPPTNLDISNSSQAYTEGLSYEGYGTLYLDILWNAYETWFASISR